MYPESEEAEDEGVRGRGATFSLVDPFGRDSGADDRRRHSISAFYHARDCHAFAGLVLVHLKRGCARACW